MADNKKTLISILNRVEKNKSRRETKHEETVRAAQLKLETDLSEIFENIVSEPQLWTPFTMMIERAMLFSHIEPKREGGYVTVDHTEAFVTATLQKILNEYNNDETSKECSDIFCISEIKVLKNEDEITLRYTIDTEQRPKAPLPPPPPPPQQTTPSSTNEGCLIS